MRNFIIILILILPVLGFCRGKLYIGCSESQTINRISEQGCEIIDSFKEKQSQNIIKYRKSIKCKKGTPKVFWLAGSKCQKRHLRQFSQVQRIFNAGQVMRSCAQVSIRGCSTH